MKSNFKCNTCQVTVCAVRFSAVEVPPYFGIFLIRSVCSITLFLMSLWTWIMLSVNAFRTRGFTCIESLRGSTSARPRIQSTTLANSDVRNELRQILPIHIKLGERSQCHVQHGLGCLARPRSRSRSRLEEMGMSSTRRSIFLDRLRLRPG